MSCHMDSRDLKQLTIRLRNFGTAQSALCRELLAAQQLGICKITTSVNGKPVFKSLDSMLENGSDFIRTDIILTKEGSKETSS